VENKLQVSYAPISSLRHPEKNPRKWSKEAREQLKDSITRFGAVDPLIINSAAGREGIILGGNFRYEIFLELHYETVPIVKISVPDPAKEAELIVRLNKNTGDWDFDLLAQYDESLLSGIGFSSEELDNIFPEDEHPEMFDLEKELAKLDIKEITVKPGDRFDFGKDIGIVMCGDSTIEADVLKLMGDDQADLCLTDPPYLLNYLKGKTKNKDGVTRGFGAKKNRVYLGTETLPDNFTELWMSNVAKVQKKDFSIIIFENPKNLKTIWTELEKHWTYRNTITWFVPNRMQGFSSKYRFFNKTDIALVGTQGDISLNLEPESDELFQNEYENALFATSGAPHWESYQKGKKTCPTDFISHIAGDKKSSGQEIIFGTKPLELLIPYLKVLTRRGDLVIEPFGGSGSSGAAAFKLGRRFRLMEKSEVYTTVILRRLEKLTGVKARLL
jgi:DNA modification methylase